MKLESREWKLKKMASLCSSISSLFDWTVLNSSCSLASGFRNCWLCGKWREAKEISHISPLFPLLTLNMQSSVSIKAIFQIQFNGSYRSSDTHNMIMEPNSNLPRETGNGSAPEMIYYLLCKLLLVCMKEAMKVTISSSAFRTLHWEIRRWDLSVHAVPGSTCKKRGQYSISSRQFGCQQFGSKYFMCYFTPSSPFLSMIEYQ